MLNRSRRDVLKLLGAGALALPSCASTASGETRTARVGVLHSFTEGMRFSEAGVAIATQVALDELNTPAGEGVVGRRVDVVLGDGASDPQVFAREARRLIVDEGVVAIFGCWTSSSRKAVLSVVEELGSFLVYPLQYEGLESSPSALYTGSTPNQQILPALRWAMARHGEAVFLVGSDYVFPRIANALMRDQLAAGGLAPVGEAYLPLEGTAGDLAAAARAIVAEIRDREPSLVVSTLNGPRGNEAFFGELRAALQPSELPALSFSIAEPEAIAMARLHVPVAGDYAAWTWLSDEADPAIAAFRARITSWVDQHPGTSMPTAITDPMVSAVAGVRLWADAWDAAGDTAATAIRERLKGRHVQVPGAQLFVDAETMHLWKPTVIGQFQADGSLRTVHRSALPERPRPYPGFRTRAGWESLLARASGS